MHLDDLGPTLTVLLLIAIFWCLFDLRRRMASVGRQETQDVGIQETHDYYIVEVLTICDGGERLILGNPKSYRYIDRTSVNKLHLLGDILGAPERHETWSLESYMEENWSLERESYIEKDEFPELATQELLSFEDYAAADCYSAQISKRPPPLYLAQEVSLWLVHAKTKAHAISEFKRRGRGAKLALQCKLQRFRPTFREDDETTEHSSTPDET